MSSDYDHSSVMAEACAADFMAVRKIPLKERRPLDEHDFPILEKDCSEGAEVLHMLQTIRSLVLTDRALYDKVGGGIFSA